MLLKLENTSDNRDTRIGQKQKLLPGWTWKRKCVTFHLSSVIKKKHLKQYSLFQTTELIFSVSACLLRTFAFEL